jgi:hypothetical protein
MPVLSVPGRSAAIKRRASRRNPAERVTRAQALTRTMSDGPGREASPLLGLGGDLSRLLGGAGFKDGPQSPVSPFGQPAPDWLKSDPDNMEQAMLQARSWRPGRSATCPCSVVSALACWAVQLPFRTGLAAEVMHGERAGCDDRVAAVCCTAPEGCTGLDSAGSQSCRTRTALFGRAGPEPGDVRRRRHADGAGQQRQLPARRRPAGRAVTAPGAALATPPTELRARQARSSVHAPAVCAA